MDPDGDVSPVTAGAEPPFKRTKVERNCIEGGGGIDQTSSKSSSSSTANNTSKARQQSSLLNFFTSNKPKLAPSSSVAAAASPSVGTSKDGNTTDEPALALPKAAPLHSKTNSRDGDGYDNDYTAIVPTTTPTPFNVVWETGLYDEHVIVRKVRGKGADDRDRTKIAAFDLDGTLLQWTSNSPGFWPSSLAHYELWNNNVITKLQDLYDKQNYRLVVFSNQGAVQKAHSGKKASLVKTLLDWIASKVDRPISAVLSTRSPKKSPQSFHKPSPKMWMDVLLKRLCPIGGDVVELDLANSFFVGDSADESDPQGGVDRKFATAIGIKFYTPHEYFGPDHQQMRGKAKLLRSGVDVPPSHALKARSALLGGYLQGPILLILCGVQGSGKSSFCDRILDGMQRAAYNRGCNVDDEDEAPTDDQVNQFLDSDPHKWMVLSQDTINNGKPGKREKVEDKARAALKEGRSVAVDRMHLDPEQRRHFIDLASDEGVPAHIVVLNPPKDVVAGRVKNRIDHPGKVLGDQGVRLALSSLERLVLPRYDEAGDVNKIQLITCASHDSAACHLAWRYGGLCSLDFSFEMFCGDDKKAKDENGSGCLKYLQSLPSISLGTMGMGRRICTETVDKMLEVGFTSIDTAPTYNNEDKIGESAMLRQYPFTIIAKVPKRAVQSNNVRTELEQSLKKLKKEKISLLLLHWPSDVIAAGTLKQVWTTMEELLKEGKCMALGVCNFNPAALATLLSVCTIPPVVNQVERHPLLSQLELIDYCARHNIYIQAHTPLGGGRDELLNHPTVIQIAKDINRSPAQVLIQWNIQQGMAVVCKCSSESHGKELLACAVDPTVKNRKRLSPDHMKALDGMNDGTRFVAPPFMYGTGDVYCWGDHMPGKNA